MKRSRLRSSSEAAERISAVLKLTIPMMTSAISACPGALGSGGIAWPMSNCMPVLLPLLAARKPVRVSSSAPVIASSNHGLNLTSFSAASGSPSNSPDAAMTNNGIVPIPSNSVNLGMRMLSLPCSMTTAPICEEQVRISCERLKAVPSQVSGVNVVVWLKREPS